MLLVLFLLFSFYSDVNSSLEGKVGLQISLLKGRLREGLKEDGLFKSCLADGFTRMLKVQKTTWKGILK